MLFRSEILFFEITKQIEEIILNIDGVIKKINNINNKYYSLITEYSTEHIIKLIDNNKFSIYINGEKVNDNIMNAMRYHGIQPKFN